MFSWMKKLPRKMRRLSVMGPREIIFRLGRKASEQFERIAYYAGRMQWRPQVWVKCLGQGIPSVNPYDFAADLQRHFQTRQEPPFLLNAASLRESKALYHRLYEHRLDELKIKADRVCEGRFSFLGIEFESPDSIFWQRDPKSGKDWPSKYHADLKIPFCDGIGDTQGAPDVKHVWELNRHEFLIDCAKAYYLTGETRYAARVFELVNSWIWDNPYLQGVNWAGPLEVAVRSFAWLWSYQFCRAWEGLSADDHAEIIRSFYQHGIYLYRHIERYTSPNNHLVGEAAALYLLGSFFPEFDEASAWRKRGWKILVAEPKRQFHADGGSTEQSTSYHHYCLGFFLLAVLTRLQQNLTVPRLMRKRLEAALEFSLWMTTPDGTVPRLGDGDDSRSLRFEPASFWDFRSFLGVGAVLFERPDFKAQAGSFGEDALWLLGLKGYRTYVSLPKHNPTPTSKIFPESGYAILRSGWGPEDHHLCFDCGPIGKGLYSRDIPIFTHGHADLLSFTLSAFGRPLIVDSGFYTFSGPPDWHRYCRDVEGHNTLSVDGVSQAKFNPANAWSCAASPGAILWNQEERSETVEGFHAGFHGLQDQVRHRRTISWNRDSQWSIRDDLEGCGKHLIEIRFHFAPGQAGLLAEDAGVGVLTEAGIHALLYCQYKTALKVDIERGAKEPEGWIATSYGRKTPAPCVRFYGEVTLPASFTFTLVASRKSFAQEIIEVINRRESDADNLCDISELLAVE